MSDNKKIKIPEDVEEFAKVSLKKYKKKYADDDYDSKKELKESYTMFLLDRFPKTIEFIVKYGHIQRDKIPEIKNMVYTVMINPDFIKAVRKEVKKGRKIDNIKLFPIIIKEFLMEIKKENDRQLAENPNAELHDSSDLVELSQMILEKKIEKMKKRGINENLAFDILSIIPCKEALSCSQFYRIHSFYSCIYEYAKSCAVPFKEIMDILVPDEYKPTFITFALLERKEKFAKLTDSQKTLYVDITNWCFNTMEKELKKSEVEAIITTYVNSRKRDDAQGKDGNRRYVLSSLSAEDYERIATVIKNFIGKDNTVKKYL